MSRVKEKLITELNRLYGRKQTVVLAASVRAREDARIEEILELLRGEQKGTKEAKNLHHEEATGCAGQPAGGAQPANRLGRGRRLAASPARI